MIKPIEQKLIPMNNPPDLSDVAIIPPSGEFKQLVKADSLLPWKLGEADFAFATFTKEIQIRRQEERALLCAEIDRGLMSDLASVEKQICELQSKRETLAKLAETPLRAKRETLHRFAKELRDLSLANLAECRRITVLIGDDFNVNS